MYLFTSPLHVFATCPVFTACRTSALHNITQRLHMQATRILQGACRDQFNKCSEIFQSSLCQPSEDNQDIIIPHRNGFVDTVVRSYCEHRALAIRPDDVWVAIVTQFNFFFVSHEDKKNLKIFALGSRYTVDFGSMTRQMTKLVDENIVDPTLRDWILPDFSTTTITDSTLSAIITMATTKEYFKYSFVLCCGIPRVTLEGSRNLKGYGDETTAWHHLLVPVVSRFVRAFDDPNSKENLGFWQRVAHYESGGSGPGWISGWINTFCAFDEKGQWKGYQLTRCALFEPVPPPIDSFSSRYDENGDQIQPEHYLTLDGIVYHRTTSDVPCGFAEVDMGKRDTAKPVIAWWIFAKKDESSSSEDGGILL
ncbi:hypothetical protein PILCRDRAFT_96257 [Piloderma croceum F 1598]|uniref:Uncharacterized protein n=1 Tax=Piloderma croceum (strain F 1598) TaxID=765440 RepID=A0A0C3G4R9_PILCF|nr:hypothetical protein PILCRDRAFT_96257 [Piloderma croceum F 1598]